MLDTYEIRWFFAAPLPQFRDWEGEREQRTDWYAPLRTRTSSVKLRESDIEAKFLLGTSRVQVGSTEVPVERWFKISQSLPSNEREQMLKMASGYWLGIAKDRTVQHYSAVGNVVSRENLEAAGAGQVEWARISLAGQRDVWTLCLEGSTGEDQLVSVATLLVEQRALDLAAFPQQQSYPSWIMEQVGGVASQG